MNGSRREGSRAPRRRSDGERLDEGRLQQLRGRYRDNPRAIYDRVLSRATRTRSGGAPRPRRVREISAQPRAAAAVRRRLGTTRRPGGTALMTTPLWTGTAVALVTLFDDHCAVALRETAEHAAR